MSLNESNRRQQRAKAARVLLALHGKGNLDQPGRWTWDAVDRLPAWCLADAADRQQLQVVCGALYLSPEIRFWIGKSVLSALNSLIGEAVFTQIMNHADSMQLPRDPLASVIEQAKFDPSVGEAAELQKLLMSAGASVLSATVHESLPRELLVGSLGEGCGEISHAAAQVLHDVAVVLLTPNPPAKVGQS